ncbi:hypothetical protein Dsin_032491 [Dipteronia sinensis]|uniref:DUF4283 domain-containing protein n=1 Tax=Dipteronia sinensis TaxID=43782 RepID=A0AAD9ZPG7_9ROSI|nr:hypothetical protein Dsin_032491 [Dipteronia sinensis]
MLVWVRLSKLPMEWIDVDLLRYIGGMLNTTFKVDIITETQARGRFTRICIEIDITKPLKSSLVVEDRVVKVEYGSMGLICFKYGRVGHNKEAWYHGNGSSIFVAETSSKNEGNGKDLGKILVGSSNMGKISTNKVLAEISNRKSPSKNHFSIAASQYLVEAPYRNKSIFNKPFKENVNEIWVNRNGMGHKKNIQPITNTTTKDMEEDIEDSAVLQSIHKEVMEISTGGDCISTDTEILLLGTEESYKESFRPISNRTGIGIPKVTVCEPGPGPSSYRFTGTRRY